MATSDQLQSTRGTALATFTQTGTYSNTVDLGGGNLIGCYSDNYPAAAGSLTFRASWNASGSGHPVMSENGVILRVNGFGSGTFYSFTPGSVPVAMQYCLVQVGTAGTAGVAAGGTVVLVTG
jgi:hypothetical protein